YLNGREATPASQQAPDRRDPEQQKRRPWNEAAEHDWHVEEDRSRLVIPRRRKPFDVLADEKPDEVIDPVHHRDGCEPGSGDHDKDDARGDEIAGADRQPWLSATASPLPEHDE